MIRRRRRKKNDTKTKKDNSKKKKKEEEKQEKEKEEKRRRRKEAEEMCNQSKNCFKKVGNIIEKSLFERITSKTFAMNTLKYWMFILKFLPVQQKATAKII